MGPTNTPLSLPVWLGGRRRDFGAGSYVFKMLSLAFMCILLGYSVSRLVSVPDIPQNGPPGVQSLTKTQPSQKEDVLRPDNLDVAEFEKPYSHEKDPPPTLYRPKELPGQNPSKGQGSFYDKFTDRFRKLNPWRAPDGNSRNHTESASEPVGAKEADLYKAKPAQTDIPDQRDPLNKTGSFERILEFSDITVDSPPLIGKVTIIFGDDRPVYDRAVRTHEFHNRLHGYPMHVLRQSILNDVWSKPAYILSVMLREMAKPRERRIKWLFWSDADTIITNPMVPLEIFLPPIGFENIDVLVTRDWNGLNNGVFLIKINQGAVNLFSRIITYPYYRPDEQLVFRDQSAMAKLLETPEFSKHVMMLPQRWFNAYQGEITETIGPHQVRHGDFLIHFAGVTNRDDRMNHWLQRAEMHSDEWEVQLRFTSYPSEIEEFWSSKKKELEEGKKAIEELREQAKNYYEGAKADAERYKEKFSVDQWKQLEQTFTKFRSVYENQNEGYDVQTLHKALQEMKMSLQPLQETSEHSNRILLKEAHDTLFSAEKLMLDNEDNEEVEREVKEVNFWVAKVKEDILKTPLNAEKTENDTAELQKRYQNLSKKLQQIAEEQSKAEEQRKMIEEQIKKQQEQAAQQKAQEEAQQQQQAQAGGSYAADQAQQSNQAEQSDVAVSDGTPVDGSPVDDPPVDSQSEENETSEENGNQAEDQQQGHKFQSIDFNSR